MAEMFVTTENKSRFVQGQQKAAPLQDAQQNVGAELEIDGAALRQGNVQKKREGLSAFQREYATHERLAGELDRSKYKGNDSGQMQAIKDHMKTIGTLLGEEMKPGKEALSVQLRTLSREYEALLTACDQYLNHHHSFFGPARFRKKLVKKVMKMAEVENTRIRDIGSLEWLVDKRRDKMILGNVLGLRTYEANQLRSKEPVHRNNKVVFNDTANTDPDQKYIYEFSNVPNHIERNAVSNIGTSRLAQFFGMEKNVRQCGLANWKDPAGETHYGFRYLGRYDGGNDKTIKEIKRAASQGTKIIYTGEALRQLNMIRILNLLAGGNQTSFEEEVLLSYSKRKDGDKSYIYISGAYLNQVNKRFSASVNGNSLRKGTGSIRRVNANSFGLIDKEMADKIAEMKDEDVKFIFGDILNDKQLAAFNSRLRYIKQELAEMKANEIGRNDYLEKNDWSSGEKSQRIKAAINMSARNTWKGFFGPNTEIEGSGNYDNEGLLNESREELYDDFYRNAKDMIDSKDTAAEKLEVLSNLTFACKKGYFDNETIGDDNNLIKQVRTRLTSEVMTSQLVYEAFSQSLDAARELKEALDEESIRDKEIPDTIHDIEAAENMDEETKEKLENEWNVYKVIARHTAAYNRYRKTSVQLDAFRRAHNRAMDSKLINVSDYINSCKTTYLTRHNMTEDDFNDFLNEAKNVVDTFDNLTYLRGEEIDYAKNAISDSMRLEAMKLLPDGYPGNGQGMYQYRRGLETSGKIRADKAAKYWSDRAEEKKRAQEAAEGAGEEKKAEENKIEEVKAEEKQNEEKQGEENQEQQDIHEHVDVQDNVENVEDNKVEENKAVKVEEENQVEEKQNEEKQGEEDQGQQDIHEHVDVQDNAENVEDNKVEENKNEEVKVEENKNEEVKVEENKIEEVKIEEENKIEEIKAKEKQEEENKIEEIKEEKKEEDKAEDENKWNIIATRELENAKAKKYFPEVTTNTSLKETESEHHKDTIVTQIDDEYSDYKIMSNQDAMKLASENPANDDNSAAFKIIYQHYEVYDENRKAMVDIKNDNATTAYVSSANSMAINQYLRARDKNDEEEIQFTYESKKEVAHESVSGDINKWRSSLEETIAEMDKATKANKLPENTRLFRFVGGNFLEYALGMEALDDLEPFENYSAPGSADELVKKINENAGKVVRDVGFMSTGYKADKAFMASPICLTILADKGTKCFVTKNIDESEIVLGRNAHYMIVGAKAHGEKGLLMPKSGFEQMYNSGEEEDKPSVEFHGLEIIVKLLNDDAQAGDGTEKQGNP